MKMYEIWAEGYRATGESSGATYFGSAVGKDFKDAVKTFFENRDDKHYLNKNMTAYWGCKLFSSESKARASFG